MQVWSFVGQASHFVCASPCFLLWSDQVIHVLAKLFATMGPKRTVYNMRLRSLVPHVVVLATVWARHAKKQAPPMRLGGVHALSCAETTRSRTPQPFCCQACDAGETGMKPE